MSTIGEALRKVQKQRMTSVAPAQDEPPHVSHAASHPSPGHSSHTPVFLAILIGVLLVSGAALYLFRGATFSIVVDGRSVSFANPSAKSAVPPPAAALPAVAPVPDVKTSAVSSVAGAAHAARPPANLSPAPSMEPGTPRPEPAAPPVRQEAIVRTDLPSLGGIFYSDKNPVAIINGSSMMEGEKAGRFLIVKIGVYAVTLRDEAGEFEIRLK